MGRRRRAPKEGRKEGGREGGRETGMCGRMVRVCAIRRTHLFGGGREGGREGGKGGGKEVCV